MAERYAELLDDVAAKVANRVQCVPSGDNILELAQKYGLTQQRVYAIIKAERTRRTCRQLAFPDLSDLFS